MIDESKLIDYLKGKKYLHIDENSTEMTSEYEKEHAWKLSRNIFINSILNEIKQIKLNHNDKSDYITVNINVGDKRFCVINDYPKYIVKEGVCKKISKHNNNSTKYTFKTNNYKTYTFTETSFGKKVFEDIKSAENTAKKLNKE